MLPFFSALVKMEDSHRMVLRVAESKHILNTPAKTLTLCPSVQTDAMLIGQIHRNWASWTNVSHSVFVTFPLHTGLQRLKWPGTFGMQQFSEWRRWPEHFVDDYRDCAVGGDVAGCAETVHNDIERDYQSLAGSIEPQHGLKDTQCRHNHSSGDTGSGNRRNGHQQYELKEKSEGKGHTLQQHDCNGTGHHFYH